MLKILSVRFRTVGLHTPFTTVTMINNKTILPTTHFLNSINIAPWRKWLLANAVFSPNLLTPIHWQQEQIIIPANVSVAVAKRQAEYLAGRILIKRLQEQLSLPQQQVPTSSDRSPEWPSDITGSISHCASRIWVGISTQISCSLGLDIEKIFTYHQIELSSQFATIKELLLVTAVGWPKAVATTLLFSAKEALYKALYLDCKHFMDFFSVECVMASKTQLHMRLSVDWSADWHIGDTLILDYNICDGIVWMRCEVRRRNIR